MLNSIRSSSWALLCYYLALVATIDAFAATGGGSLRLSVLLSAVGHRQHVEKPLYRKMNRNANSVFDKDQRKYKWDRHTKKV